MKKRISCLLIGCMDGTKILDREKEIIRGEHKYYNSIYYNVCQQLTCAATYLHAHGYSYRLIVSFHENMDALNEALEEDVTVVAIYSKYIKNALDFQTIVTHIRQRNSKAKIIVGGSSFVSISRKLAGKQQQLMMKYIGADYYINRYECNAPLLQILEHVSVGKVNLAIPMPNVYYRSQSQFLSTGQSHEITYRDDVFMTDWRLFKDLISNIVVLRTTLNCAFSCSFCTLKNDAEQFHVLDREQIIKELDIVCSLPGVDGVFFTDETINYPYERFIDLLKMMSKKQYPMKWISFFRCQYIDEPASRLLQKSNCIAAILGLESGSNQMLQAMNKQVAIPQIEKGHRILQQVGIHTFGFFIVGFPGENWETIEETIAYINRIRPTFYVLNKWVCESETAIWEARAQVGLSCRNGSWKHSTMDCDQADRAIVYMRSKIRNSICINQFDLMYVFHLLLEGYRPEEIRQIIARYGEMPLIDDVERV